MSWNVKGEVHTRKSFSRDVIFRKSFKNDDEQKKPQVKSSFRSRDIDDSLFSIVTSLGSEGKFQNINFMTTRRSTSYFPNKKSNLLQTFTDNSSPILLFTKVKKNSNIQILMLLWRHDDSRCQFEKKCFRGVILALRIIQTIQKLPHRRIRIWAARSWKDFLIDD